MKKLFILSIFIFVFMKLSPVFTQIIYTDPLDKAKYVNVHNSIILGFSHSVDTRITEDKTSFTITGSKSGSHSGKIILVENNRKIIFEPDMPFEYDEKITVIFNSGNYIKQNKNQLLELTFETVNIQTTNHVFKKNKDFYSYDLFIGNENSDFPGEIPELSVTINNSPSAGKIFMSNFPFTNIPNVPHLIIADNTGEIYTGVKLPTNALDFKRETNGNLVYFNSMFSKYYELNNEYKLIDSFYCGNGYITDGHEIKILNNEHALLMSYDTQTVNMSQLVQGGNPNCLVIGLIIQEIDQNKNVVFQWRSWDHIPITDAQHQDMTAEYLDYIHGNAIDQDSDGNILISSRHLDEITKINRETGNIMWRLGGPDNQFTFLNDPDNGFTFQHGIRRLPNGNLILFDNGNFHTPPHSRAVEYTIDETNMTATLAWQYRNTPDNFGFAMGFAQRLDNGNTLISWGSSFPTLTEVTSAGEIALEMSLPQGLFTYRAFKFAWDGKPLYIDLTAARIPESFRLSQNYPNPFNPVTKIDFDLPKGSFVNLSVFDVLGRLVQNIYNTELPAGPYSVNFNSSQLPSGVYFYRLKTDSFTDTKKMVIVK